MDACFAGNIWNVLLAIKRDANVGTATPPAFTTEDVKRNYISRKMRQKSRIVLSSGNKAVPDGEPGRGSPFANRIRGAIELSYERGYLTFEQLFDSVFALPSEPVYAPILNYPMDGGFIFFRPGG